MERWKETHAHLLGGSEKSKQAHCVKKKKRKEDPKKEVKEIPMTSLGRKSLFPKTESTFADPRTQVVLGLVRIRVSLGISLTPTSASTDQKTSPACCQLVLLVLLGGVALVPIRFNR